MSSDDPNFKPHPRKFVTRKFLGKTFSAAMFNEGRGWIITNLSVKDGGGNEIATNGEHEAHLYAQVVVDAYLSAMPGGDGKIPDVSMTEAPPLESEDIKIQLAHAAQMLPGGREQLMAMMSATIIEGGLGQNLLAMMKAAVEPESTAKSLLEKLLKGLKDQIRERNGGDGEGCGDPDCPNCGPAIKAAKKAADPKNWS